MNQSERFIWGAEHKSIVFFFFSSKIAVE